MKTIEKQQAIALRKSGKSIPTIAKHLNVSKSSVSLWVQEVVLTPKQRADLDANSRRATNRAHYAKLRQTYREQGAAQAKLAVPLHLIGCMLYWAEGGKASPHAVDFTNSDPRMIKLFAKFLIESLQVPEAKIKASINCYTDVCSKEEIEKYWKGILAPYNITFYKTLTNHHPTSSKNKRHGKCKHGTCKLRVYSVQLQQHIYGAIIEYSSTVDAPHRIPGIC